MDNLGEQIDTVQSCTEIRKLFASRPRSQYLTRDTLAMHAVSTTWNPVVSERGLELYSCMFGIESLM